MTSLNTFKKGDVVKSWGVEFTVAYTDGPFVHFIGGGYSSHEGCTLVPAKPKFGPGDVVSNGLSENAIKCVKTAFGDPRDPYSRPIAYDYTNDCWDYESSLTIVRRAVPIIDLIKADKFIEAIKQHRTINGTGLKEAKDAVEAIRYELKRSGFAAVVAAPKFKIGDRVTHKTMGKVGVGVIRSSEWPNFWKVDWANGWTCTDPEKSLVLVPSTPTIVIRRDPGKGYRPNDNPRIHESVALATKEAERLAIANPGVEFATFTLAGTSTATAPLVKTVAA
jgi:hypothetical protein